MDQKSRIITDTQPINRYKYKYSEFSLIRHRFIRQTFLSAVVFGYQFILYAIAVNVIRHPPNPPPPLIGTLTSAFSTCYLTLNPPGVSLAIRNYLIMATKRSRTELTITQKQEICTYKEKNTKATQEQLADHFSKQWKTSIARRTIGDILKRKADWDVHKAHQIKVKRMRKPKFEAVEEALGMWFQGMQAKKAIITDAILLEKGKYFAERLNCEEFVGSSGWLGRFKSRNGISLKLLHGEGASIDSSVALNGRSELRKVTSAYDPQDIYNMDETGLFYRMPPSKTLAQGPRQGTKQYKDRITLALCTNSDGSDSFKPLVIGKSARPRCFRDFHPGAYVMYYNNQKAWMTRYIFSEWLHHFDDYITRKKNRPVLLLLDNVASHFPSNVDDLKCVKLHYLPPNTTSQLQPLDAGIIKAFKAWYRRSQLKRLIQLLEDGKKPDINLREALCYIAVAWKTISTTTISNCWKHTGIMSTTIENSESDSLAEENDLSILLDTGSRIY